MPAKPVKKIRVYKKVNALKSRTGVNSYGTPKEVYQAHCGYCSYKSPNERTRAAATYNVADHRAEKHFNKVDAKRGK